MSENIKPVLFVDPTINDITDQTNYLVKQSGSSVNYVEYSANTQSTSQITFNCQIPSENIILDREILIQSQLRFKIKVNIVGTGTTKVFWNYGETDFFGPFPLNNLIQVANAQINNVNISSNIQEILPAILKIVDKKQLLKYNSTTCALPDCSYKYYSDGFTYSTGGPNNYAVTNISSNYGGYGFDNSSLNGEVNTRASIRVLGTSYCGTNVDGVTNPNINIITDAAGGTDGYVYLDVVFTEPLFMSPFIFCKNENNCAGMLGINQLNISLTLDQSAKRCIRTGHDNFKEEGANTVGIGFTHEISLVSVSNSKLLVRQISTQPSQLVPSKNVVPYTNIERFNTVFSQLTRPSNYVPTATNYNSYNFAIDTNFTTTDYTSQTLSLSSIPDYFVVFVRKQFSDLRAKDSDSFLPISKCVVSFNNQSGLLSSMSREQLFKMSQKNGSNQSFYEFVGLSSENTRFASATSVVKQFGNGVLIATVGSVLVISPEDLGLANYLAPGSVGQYNFQIKVSVENVTKENIIPELVVLTVNSGVLVNLAGTSQIYTGLLNKEIVLQTASEQAKSAWSSTPDQRLVGGGMSQIGSAMVSAMKKPKTVKPVRALDLLS